MTDTLRQLLVSCYLVSSKCFLMYLTMLGFVTVSFWQGKASSCLEIQVFLCTGISVLTVRIFMSVMSVNFL